MSIPRVESQRSTQVSDVSDQSGDSDLLVNNLVYTQPKALSLATNRTYTRHYFQRDSYSGDRSSTAIADWNTGTAYVNVFNSYLTFKVKLTGTDAEANWGSGSAMNCINEIRIRSRSGTELDRLQLANLWSKYDALYSKPDPHLKTLGSVQGWGEKRSGDDDDACLSDDEKRFCIPLTALSPFFRPLKKQLLPPQMASGLHFEIVLEDFKTALFSKGGTVEGYAISGLQFMLDTVEMTDDVQKTINMESAQDGLEYAYERIFTAQSQQPSNQLQLSQQIRKAVSQACLATTIVLDSADKIDLAKDSLTSVPFDTTSFQYRLGALYFPHQKVEGSTTDSCEAYCIAQQVYDKFQHPFAESSVTMKDFKIKYGIMSASFEKDTHLNMSGLPINNSRVLELNCEFDAVASPREIITFLQYCAVSRVYIDNTAVAV